MQYSDVSGGNNDAERVARSRGILLIRNDLSIRMVRARSFLAVAFASISNEARMRSTIVD